MAEKRMNVPQFAEHAGLAISTVRGICRRIYRKDDQKLLARFKKDHGLQRVGYWPKGYFLIVEVG